MLRKLISLLSTHEKKRGAWVLIMVTVMAVLETAGVASVMPFLSVLGNPEVVHTNQTLSSIYTALDFTSVDDFLMLLGAAAFVLILGSALFRMLTHYVMNRFIEMRRHSLGERLLETYLRQPYAFFLNRHTSDMAKSILSEVDQVVAQVFRPAMEMLAYCFVLAGILILIFMVHPVVAVLVALIFGGVYGVIYLIVRRVLGRIGQERVDANRGRFNAAGEALGGIKDIKLLGREHAYLSRFRVSSKQFARHQATNQTLSKIPNFLVEAIAFGSILILCLYLLAEKGGVDGGGISEILPVLGVYAFAGLRMKPAAQKIYAGMARLRFGAAAMDVIYDDLRQRSALAVIRKSEPDPLTPKRSLALEDIYYRYPGSEADALESIDLDIPVGAAVGLVGSTGAGKTTLVDVLLGLLRPTHGRICVDDETVSDDNLRSYQKALGYVPQEIFLTDSTVAENIALGVSAGTIDHEHVEHCARLAQIHEFITEEMPQQYDTMVGERGVRLSGGQRQRIGIARALYHNPDVLVFDEATSALDTVTEQAVMKAIESLHAQKTIVMIAHRIDTVRSCDQIALLDKGRIVAKGSFDELRVNHQGFRSMVSKSDLEA